MGEIFERTRPNGTLPFTGERFTTAVEGEIEVEHLHRYVQARDLCRGKDVLDVASGEGYGAALLAQVARTVTGVEIDPATVEHAARMYGAANLAYLVGDARRIPLDDASVDVVTSFETIEHFYEHGAFLREVRRVLRPDGVLVISTPDQSVYSVAGEPANPFHVHELSKQEFHDALGREFPHVAMFAQRVVHGSTLVRDGDPAGPFVTYEKRDERHFERSQGLPRAKYLVAYASGRPLPDALSAASVYIDADKAERTSEFAALRRVLAEHQAAMDGWQDNERRWSGDLAKLHAELDAAQQRLEGQDAAFGATQAKAAALADELARARAASAGQAGVIAGLEAQAAAAQVAADRQAEAIADVLAQLQADRAALTDAAAQARAAADRQAGVIAALQAANAALADEAAQARASLDRQAGVIAALQAGKAALTDEAAQARASLDRQAGAIAALQAGNAALADEAAQARAALDRQVEAVADVLGELQAGKAALADEAAQAQADVDRQAGVIAALQAGNAALAGEAAQARAALAQQAEALEASESTASVLLERSATDRQEKAALRARSRGLEQAASEAAASAQGAEARRQQSEAAAAQQLAAARDALAERDAALALLRRGIQEAQGAAQAQQAQLRFLDRFLGLRASYPQPEAATARRDVAQARRHARRRNWIVAERLYRQALLANSRLPRAWVQYGHAVKEQGDLWAALGAYGHAVRLDAANADAWVHVGHAQKSLGLPQEAAASLQQALCLRPSQMAVWDDLRALGQDPEAALRRFIDAGSQAVPLESPAGWASRLRFTLARRRARAAARRREWALAVRGWREALRWGPHDPRSWVMLGHASKEAGDANAARAAYLQALVLDPVNQEPRKHLDALPHAAPDAGPAWPVALAQQPAALPPLAHDAPPRRSGVFVLAPGQDLQALGGGAFLSTGYDPQFALTPPGGAFPHGPTLLTIEMAQADPLLRPILFIWNGGGIQEVALPLLSGAGTAEVTLRLPEGVTELRFDPTNEPGARFAITRIAFQERDMDVEPDNAGSVAQQEYGIWVRRYDTLNPEDAAAIRQQEQQLAWRPLISVVMPVYNPDPHYLRRALDTVAAQLYGNWELCIADDASTNPEIRRVLKEYAAREERIKVVFRKKNGHISAASNSALELAQGAFVALMDHDDELPAHALYMVAVELNRHPEADILYTDEDKIDSDGRRHDPHFKTDWNLDLFYSQNIVAHLGVYRTALARRAGGFRVGFEGSQDYDFTLRVLRLTSRERIRHIPFVLYHWRIFTGVRSFSSDNPDKSVATARRALADHFAATGQQVEVLPIPSFPSWWRIKRPLPGTPPSVTLIVPTCDRLHLVRNCVEGLLYGTTYPNLDVIIVDNGSVEPDTLAWFADVQADARVQVLRVEGPFNYSALNNRAVEMARGEYVGLVNNDVEVKDPGWLQEMMAQAVRPGVGAVGAKLLYASGAIQHAGVTLGVYGVAAHGHRNYPADAIGYFGRPQLQQELSAVTAALLVMPRRVFHEVGGLDEAHLAVGYNDVDLCLRVRAAGYQIVYTPFAELFHLESASRGANKTAAQQDRDRRERATMQDRWGALLQHDPHYSPNLSLADETFRIAFPPRTAKPWLEPGSGIPFPVREQRRFDAAYPVDEPALRALAAQTAVVVVSAACGPAFARLAEGFAPSGLAPARIVVVDATGQGTEAAALPGLERLQRLHPAVAVALVRDGGQDFSRARAVNLGVAAAQEAYVLVAAEDAAFPAQWFDTLLRAFLAQPGPVVASARLRLPDGGIEVAASLADPECRHALARAAGGGELPAPRSLALDAAGAQPVLRPERMLGGGVFFARRDVLCRAGADVFDERLLAVGWEEDLSRHLQAQGVSFASTSASLPSLLEARPCGIAEVWRHVHDYAWATRKWAGGSDSGAVEFICPFHRGDVLIGVQVAEQAWRAGADIRMHVAEGLLGWVRDFAPSFPVEPIPVAIPSAERTALHLLQSCLHVVQRPDASPRVALSHSRRGLDETGRNLVESMLEAVGLPRGTLLTALRPQPDAGQVEMAARLLRPFGGDAVLVHCAGGWQLKTIPAPVLRALLDRIQRAGFKAVQIGGPGDAQLPGFDGWITAGLSAGDWAALFARGRAVVGVDSWSAHLASILDVPQVSLYGSTHPRYVNSKRFFAEQRAPSLVLGPVVDCSPCHSLTCRRAPVDFCMGYALDEAAVTEFLHGLAATVPG